MAEKNTAKTIEDVIKDLRIFIWLSLKEQEQSWDEWILATTKKIITNCWERKKCGNMRCPAYYKNECGRCWLIAGTMCGGEVQGNFAKKYRSCLDCEVYQEAVLSDPVIELREHILILIHSLRIKHQELQQAKEKANEERDKLREALAEVKTLRGFIPICSSCKKIRDDQGFWKQIEAYISAHTHAQFSHGICPECLAKLYPEFVASKEK